MTAASGVAAWALDLAARGLLPDRLLRPAIRHGLAATVAEARATAADTPSGRAAFHARLAQAPPESSAPAPARDDGPPAAFFDPWLGPRMKYSCALWSGGAADLAAAEGAMLALTCERAGIADGHAVLDLGCGWGALSLYVAERFPRARVTALTDVPEQARYVAAAAAARGLSAPRVVVADLRRLALAGTFDRIVAIEALEHARDWPGILAQIRGALAPHGLLFAQFLACRDWGSTYGPGEPGAWLGRRFLAGAMMPDDGLLAATNRDLVEERRWVVSGLDYARTVEAWLERFHRAGRTSPAHRGAMARRWRLMLVICAAMFAYDEGRLWRVVQAIARPRPARPAPLPPTPARPYS